MKCTGDLHICVIPHTHILHIWNEHMTWEIYMFIIYLNYCDIWQICDEIALMYLKFHTDDLCAHDFELNGCFDRNLYQWLGLSLELLSFITGYVYS